MSPLTENFHAFPPHPDPIAAWVDRFKISRASQQTMMVLPLNTLGISLPIDKWRTECLENWRCHGVRKLRWKWADGWVSRVTHGY